MKRNVMTAVFAVSLTVPFAGLAAYAQAATDGAAQAQTQNAGPHEHGRHERDPHKMAMHLSKKLGLNADQAAKLEPILADRQQKMMALKSDTSMTREQRHTQMQAIQKGTQEQLAGVLTPDQMEKMKGMMHHGHRGGDHADGPAGA